MKKSEIADRELSYLPTGKKFTLVWTDEFDGLNAENFNFKNKVMPEIYKEIKL